MMKILIKSKKGEFASKKREVVQKLLGPDYLLKQKINMKNTKNEILIENPIREIYKESMIGWNKTLNNIFVEIKRELSK